MAEEPGRSSPFNSIGTIFVAVVLAVTATRTLSIKDTRPAKPEISSAAGSQDSVVFAQLWEDPFQAVDRYFQQQPHNAGEDSRRADYNRSASCDNRALTLLLLRENQRACLKSELEHLKDRNEAIEAALPATGDVHAPHPPISTKDAVQNLSTFISSARSAGGDEKLQEDAELLVKQLQRLQKQELRLQDAAKQWQTGSANQAPVSGINVVETALQKFEPAFEEYEDPATHVTDVLDKALMGAMTTAVTAEHDSLDHDLESIISVAATEPEAQLPSSIAFADPCDAQRGQVVMPQPFECISGSDKSDLAVSAKFVVVMVNGGSFENVAESRRRQRYSVVTALSMSGYQPEDPDRIHLSSIEALVCSDPENVSGCTTTPPHGCTENDQRGCVPFDRFKLSPSDILQPQRRSEEIVVLWLRDDDVFNTGPRSALDILKQIAKDVYPRDLYHKSALAVVGPPNSGSLEELFKEVSGSPGVKPPCDALPAKNDAKQQSLWVENRTTEHSCAPDDQPHPGLHIFDDEATKGLPFEVQDTLSFNADPSIGMKYRFPEWLPGDQGFCFSRSGAPDASLARELSTELDRRNLTDGASRILLVVDGGSVFAQSLQHHLEDYLSQRKDGANSTSPNYVFTSYFYPGVDGHLSGEFTGRTGVMPEGQQSTHMVDVRAPNPGPDTLDLANHAAGPMQVDYIRRLATLADTSGDRRPIGAVGIVSTDIYDKLLIVQALRPVFPKALFFTTNLDASMAETEMTNSTRGMIVASNFGLRSALTLGQNTSVPVFRDDYETANFLTTLYVAHCDVNDIDQFSEAQATDLCDKLKVVVAPRNPPPLYQIGRSGVPLQLTSRGQAGLAPIGGKLSIPARVLIGLGFVCVVFGIRYVNLLALGNSSKASLARLFHSISQMDRHFWISAATAAVPLLILAFWQPISHVLTEAGEGEGLGWTDGVSLWPAVWLQVLACFVAGWFIHLVFCLLNRNTILLANKFRLDKKEHVISELLRHKLHFHVDVLLREPPSSVGKRRELVMEVYWRDYYLGRCAVISRSVRAAACTGFVFAAVEMVQWALPSGALLTRGSLVKSAYFGSSALCAALVIFLVSLVFDATLNSRLFVNRVRNAGETDWPTDAVSKFGSSLGFSGPRLSDWIDLRFTSTRTTVILVLVWFPFVVMALMMSAKVLSDRINDASFIAEILIATAMLMFCVASLRNEAEKQRMRALKRLHDLASRISCPRAAADGAEGEGSDRDPLTKTAALPMQPNSVQIDMLIERIEAMQSGAFAPALQQPLIKAILVPIATGAWPLIEQYAAR